MSRRRKGASRGLGSDGVVDGQQETLAKHDLELVRVQLLLMSQGKHDQVERVVGYLHLGALVALEDVLDDECVDAEQLGDFVDRLGRWVGQVHPQLALAVGVRAPNVTNRVKCLDAGRLGPRQRPDRRAVDLVG